MSWRSGRRRAGAVVEFAHAFVNSALNRVLHGRDSVHTEQALVSLVVALRAAVAAGVEPPLALQFSDLAIHHDGEPLLAPSLQARPLLRELAKREVAALAFAEPLGVEEANRLFDLLLLAPNRQALQREHRDRSLRAFGVRSVRVTLRSPADPGDRSASLAAGRPADLHHYQDLAASLQQNHARALRDQVLSVDSAQSAVAGALLRLEQEPSGLLSLAAQDNVDRFTVGHSVRVALLALQVARAAGATRERLVEVGTAALLHDIGKSKVPQEILFKRGALDEDEWRWMAQHPRLGAEILLEQHDVDPHAVGAAFCHHLRPDGGGYPHTGLRIEQSATSRLVRVCDVFEALTAVRPYKRALTPLEAYAVMRRDPHGFDQRWFRLFVRTLGLFPQGSRVLLDDGSPALVLRQTADPAAPVVRLLGGPDGAELPADAPDEFQVGATVDGMARRITTLLAQDRSVPVPDPDGPGPDEGARAAPTVDDACRGRPDS